MADYQIEPPPHRLFDFTSHWRDWLFNAYKYIVGDLTWHEIGGSDEPAFQNLWANVGGATDETAAYKRIGDNLYLKGYIDSGTITDGTVIFTLPVGYRPNNNIRVAGMFITGGSENSYRIEIQTDGDVAIYGVSGATPELDLHQIVCINN